MAPEPPEDQERSEHQIVPVGYDPLARLIAEQQTFNESWIGKRKPRGTTQKLGFFFLSLAFASVGLLVCLDSWSLIKSGVVFMFGIGLIMLLVGSLGLIKVIRYWFIAD